MGEVTYKCVECGEAFQVEQGSRQRYCPPCLVKRISVRTYKQGKCEFCGKEGSIVKHHQTYDMLRQKRSPKGQVISVCLSCHRKIHAKYPARNNSK